MNTIYVMQNENGEQYWIHRIVEGRVYDDINEYSSELEFDEIKTFNVITEYEYNALLSLYHLHNNSNNNSMIYMKMFDELQQNAMKHSTPLYIEIMKHF